MLVDVNFLLIPVVAFIPLIIGFLWYSKSLFGNIWMKEAGLTEEDLSKGNMIKVLGLTYLLSCMAGFVIITNTIHQLGFQSMIMEAQGWNDQTSPLMIAATKIMTIAGDKYRTFGHGALHGTVLGLFMAFPIIGINGLFERKSFKYIALHAGYWIIAFMLMGGVLCKFA